MVLYKKLWKKFLNKVGFPKYLRHCYAGHWPDPNIRSRSLLSNSDKHAISIYTLSMMKQSGNYVRLQLDNYLKATTTHWKSTNANLLSRRCLETWIPIAHHINTPRFVCQILFTSCNGYVNVAMRESVCFFPQILFTCMTARREPTTGAKDTRRSLINAAHASCCLQRRQNTDLLHSFTNKRQSFGFCSFNNFMTI